MIRTGMDATTERHMKEAATNENTEFKSVQLQARLLSLLSSNHQLFSVVLWFCLNSRIPALESIPLSFASELNTTPTTFRHSTPTTLLGNLRFFDPQSITYLSSLFFNRITNSSKCHQRLLHQRPRPLLPSMPPTLVSSFFTTTTSRRDRMHISWVA